MYAETFGILGASPAVENAAKWVQWVQSGLTSGATENEAAIRYNLDQFWRAKAAAYPGEDETGRAQLERLDTFAQGFWNALETGKIYSSSPSYWSFWKKFWMGGAPDRPEAISAATNAAEAATMQEAAAKRAGGTFGANMATYAQQSKANIPQDLAASAGLWKQAGVAPLGVPMWAWLAGAAALGVLLLMPRGK